MRGETVTVYTPDGYSGDEYGNRLPLFTTATVKGVIVWQESSVEKDADHQDVVTTLTKALIPAGVAVSSAGELGRSDGSRWAVMGEPDVLVSPFTGRRPGTVVQLRRIT